MKITLCGVVNCRNSLRIAKDETGQPIRLFSCPKDSAVRKKWERASGRQRSRNAEPFKVCLDHFTDEDWDLKSRLLGLDVRKRRLKTDAVPSLNLPGCSLPTPTEQRFNKRERAKLIKQALTEYEKKKEEEVALHTALEVEPVPPQNLPDYALQTPTKELRLDQGEHAKIINQTLPEYEKKKDDEITLHTASEIEAAPIETEISSGNKDEMFVVEYVVRTQVGEWRSWCSLCAKCPDQDSGVQFPELLIADRQMLEPLLGSLSVQDNPRICVDCQNTVSELRLYQKNCINAQYIFSQIQNRNLEDLRDLHQVRLEFGIDSPLKIVQQETKIMPVVQPEPFDDSVPTMEASTQLLPPPNSPTPKPSKPPTTYPCSVCDDRFFRKSDCASHKKDIHNITEEYMCDICGKIMSSNTGLKLHAENHSEEYSWHCAKCPKKFKSRTVLRKHVRVYHDDKKYVCPEPGCGITLSNRCTYTTHKLTHANQKLHKCPGCNAAFNVSRALKGHLLAHLNYRRYQCPFCIYASASATSFVKHTTEKHPELVAEYEASGRKISRGPPIPTLRELEAMVADLASNGHIAPKMRTKPDLLKCRSCGESFAGRAALLRHRRAKHPAPTDFECDICTRTFHTRSQLQLHEQSHSPEQRQKCAYCYKTFLSTRMMLQHSNVCPYRRRRLSCKEPGCSLQFRSYSLLRLHARSHQPTKKHKCNGCDASYNYTDVLKNHILTFHYNFKRYHCPFCDLKTVVHRHFVWHTKKHHPDLVAQYEAAGRQVIVSQPLPRLSVLQEKVKTMEPL